MSDRDNFSPTTVLTLSASAEHEKHEELLDWLGDGFDPEAFSADEVNRRLAPLQRRRTKVAGKK
jgi:hypothetical protein